MKNFVFIALAFILLSTSSCKKQYGCTQINAINFSPKADIDDGSCRYNDNQGGNSQETSGTGWTNGPRKIYIWFGYADSGAINGQRTVIPRCEGESGCFHTTKLVEGGTYDLYAQSDDGNVWKQTIVIAKGCNTFLLDQSGIHKKELEGMGIVIPMQPKPSTPFIRKNYLLPDRIKTQ